MHSNLGKLAFGILLMFCGIIACSPGDDASRDATGTVRSRETLPTPPMSNDLVVKITRVIDGDTFHVLLSDGSTDKLRLLGVDTPETATTNKQNEYRGITDVNCLNYWGMEATEFVTNMIEGRSVRVRLDALAGKRGFYGRLLAYILVGERDLGSLLLESGYARVYREGESFLEQEYLQLEEAAHEAKKGLWGCSARAGPRGVSSPSDHRYDLAGPDRDCGDFLSWEEAQAFFEGAGGPSVDRHRLDGDSDGIACERLRTDR